MMRFFMLITAVTAVVSAGHATPATMVVRTADAADKAIELSQISEVVFDDEMVCVKMTSGADFTMADSKFISFRFDNNGGNSPDASSITLTESIDSDGEVTVYDMSGRKVGSSVSGLGAGIYLISKPGGKATKTIVK